MTAMRDRVDLAVVPTSDQVRRFRALSPSERYRWIVGMLMTTHGLASPEAKQRWQQLRQAQSGGFLSVVSAFARSLDRADFDEASRWLSPRCTYDTGTLVLDGIEAIVSAY